MGRQFYYPDTLARNRTPHRHVESSLELGRHTQAREGEKAQARTVARGVHLRSCGVSSLARLLGRSYARARDPMGAPMTTADEETPPRSHRWLAWTIFLASAAWVAVGSTLLLVDLANGSYPAHVIVGQFALLPPAAAFSIAGLVVALKQPRNSCGWLMLAIGALWSLGVSPPTPRGSTLEWATDWTWILP